MRRTLTLFFFAVVVLANVVSAEEPKAGAPQSGEPRGRTLDLPDFRLHFELEGSGPPLVMVHGGLSNSAALADRIARLSKEFTVIAPDCRGRGRSTYSDKPLTYAQMADDVVALLDYLKIPSAHILGFSDGAIIGLQLAIRRPERVRAVIAFSANTRSEDFLVPESAKGFGAWTPETIPHELREQWEKSAPDPSRWPMVASQLIRLWHTQPNFTDKELAGIKARVLIGAGDQDDIKLEHTVEIFRAIPGAQLMIVPGATHGAYGDRPALVAQAIEEFLRAEAPVSH